MGQLIHKKGDFTTSTALILAHGCNCRGGFGSGVAGQIAKMYPLARQSYLSKFETEGWQLGDVQFVPIETDPGTYTDPERIIANCATQDTYGRIGVHVNYSAISTCFKKLCDFAQYMDAKIAIPHIGAGLAGGDWRRIQKTIENVLFDYNSVVIECYDYEQGQ